MSEFVKYLKAGNVTEQSAAEVIEEQGTEIERLRAALKPFADAITLAEKDEPSFSLELAREHITLHDFTCARRALEP